MSLLEAHQKLLAAGSSNETSLVPASPVPAVRDLLRFVERGGVLESEHPWELAPTTCRALESMRGYTPAGGWSRLAGLAAGTGLLEATSERFVPCSPSSAVERLLGDGRRQLLEAFTCRLIPPAAAAALYVSLDVHPLWGLELGRTVGATKLASPIPARSATAVDQVGELVFGTLTGLITSMRCLSPDKRYPTDQLGDVLWWSAESARRLSSVEEIRDAGFPVFLEGASMERRLLTTRLAVQDLLDFVFVPAGIARRDDSAGFVVDRDGLVQVSVGEWDLEAQLGWWNAALTIPERAAC